MPDENQVAYEYDGVGRMISRSVNDVKRTFHHQGIDAIAEVLPSGEVNARYTMAGGIISMHNADTPHFFHSNAIGSIVAVTDANGNVEATYETDAYGNLISSTGTLDNDFRFVGAYGVRYDEVTGLYYMRARWYDAEAGRFLSRDLLENDNRYVYCKNSPINFIDPLGLFPGEWDPPTSHDIEERYQNRLSTENSDTTALSFLIGAGERVEGAAIGIGVGALLYAFAPEELLVGLALILTGIGSVETGATAYEATSGRYFSIDGSGELMTRDERSERIGALSVDLLFLLSYAHPWTRQGRLNDNQVLRLKPYNRVRHEWGNMPLKKAVYERYERLLPHQRPVKLGDIDFREIVNTAKTGPTTLGRLSIPAAVTFYRRTSFAGGAEASGSNCRH